MEWMLRKKARNKVVKAILASVKKEMAEPRRALSVRAEAEHLAAARAPRK